MEKIIVLIAMTLFSAIGWWAGAFYGTFTAFILSVFGTAAGVYFGRKFVRDHLP